VVIAPDYGDKNQAVKEQRDTQVGEVIGRPSQGRRRGMDKGR